MKQKKNVFLPVLHNATYKLVHFQYSEFGAIFGEIKIN